MSITHVGLIFVETFSNYFMTSFGTSGNDPQHSISIGVEVVEGRITICICNTIA